MINWTIHKINMGNNFWKETLLYDTDVWALFNMLDDERENQQELATLPLLP